MAVPTDRPLGPTPPRPDPARLVAAPVDGVIALGRQPQDVVVMLNLLRIKFSDPMLRQQLVDTGDAELVEGNAWNDTFWGVSLKTGMGKNWLGRLLMQVRDEAHPYP